jgi:TonB family protein
MRITYCSILTFIVLPHLVAAAEWGSLLVKTKPESCNVYLDGYCLGKSPANIPGIKAGGHRLSVWKPGYDILHRDVSIEGGKRLVGTIELAACGVERDSVLRDSLAQARSIPDRNAYIKMEKDPVVLRHAAVQYPIEAKESGIEGRAYLQLLVDYGGKIMRVELARSSGNASLDQAAMDAGKSVLFSPCIAPGGVPVRVWVMYPVTFKLMNQYPAR